MRIYALSLGAGLLVGIIYSLLNVRSPAPPLVALVGLFGILLGEQIIPIGKQVLEGSGLHVAWERSRCAAHLFGMLPGRHAEISVENTREEPS
ncbi:MAG: XapX domain-containing protein [Alphaproteobacteria bacterium]|nr:XapX domain-containing protein [Alphaproteobacteria bacterium]